MSNRIYMFIALGFLIGAPIIVQLLSSALPVAPRIIGSATSGAQHEPAPSAAVAATVPPEPRQQPQPQAPSADALVDSSPTLDPHGIDPAAVASQDAAEAPPPAPVASRVIQEPVEPPPRRPVIAAR